MKKAYDIIQDWLRDHGYDGLCEPDSECGCSIDELAPCCCTIQDCVPAYRVACPEHGASFSTVKDTCPYCAKGEE